MFDREEHRRLARRWLRRGDSKAEVARRLEVAWWTVWVSDKRRLAEGPRSWREHQHPGPACSLTAEQRKELQKILLEGARAHGYEIDLWTLKRMAEGIWDNGRIHRSVEGKTFLWEHRTRLETRRFPPYAPELDPDEQVWTVLKHLRLANWCPKTEEEIRAGVERELQSMQAHPELVASFIRHSEVPFPALP